MSGNDNISLMSRPIFGRLRLSKKHQNGKICTNKHKGKSFVHLFKGGGVEGWSPSSLSADSEIPLFQKNGARGEKCESISRGGVGEVCFTRSPSPFYIPKQTYPPKRSGGTFWTKQLPQAFCTVCTRPISFSTD